MRIGVNVPSALLKQAREFEPRMNISQICREAIQQRVEIAERARALAREDHELIERLDTETTPRMREPDWVSFALEDAREWVREMTREDWERFTYELDRARLPGEDAAEFVRMWSQFPSGKGFGHRVWEYQDWILDQFNRPPYGESPVPRVSEEYSRAWLLYVNEARRMLERRRKEEYDQLMAERELRRRELAAPELPEHLL